MSHLCKHCGNNFKTEKSLYFHQRNANYCLEKQSVKDIPTCQYCKEIINDFSHEKKCGLEMVNNLKQEIARLTALLEGKDIHINILSEQLKDFTEHLKTMSNRPTTTVNNKVRNTQNNITLQCITDEHIKKSTEFLELKDLDDPSSLAIFTAQYPFKDRVAIPDYSRKIFAWKGPNGKIVKDPKGKEILTKLLCAIKDHRIDLLNGIIEKANEFLGDPDNILLYEKLISMWGIIKYASSEKCMNEPTRKYLITELCDLLPKGNID